MLNIVLGRSGSGKTTYVRDLLGNKAKAGEDKLLLIVPEQFSYSSERALLETFGPIIANRIEVLSFSRLADFVNRKVGGINGVKLDDADKIILLLHAISGIKDSLEFYKDQADKTYFSKDLISLFSEFNKQCIGPEDLKETTNNTLNKKLIDIGLILNEYNSLLELNSYTDDDLIINQVIKAIREKNIFDEYTICIDAFKGFTGQELAIINEFRNSSKEFYITLPLDPNFIDKPDPSMIFGAVLLTYESIYKEGDNVITLDGHRTENKALTFLEENLFTANSTKFTAEDDTITLFEADTKYDECNYIAAKIRKFERENGMRLSDMAIIARNEDSYKSDILSAVSRFGIKIYEDRRQPIASQPLIIFCKALISLLTKKDLSTKDLLAMLKTGISGLRDTDALLLENYVFIWNVQGKDWESDFVNYQKQKDPSKDKIEEDKLDSINKCRKAFIEPILELKAALPYDCKANSLDTCKAIYNYLIKIDIKNNLLNYARSVAEIDFDDVATEQNTVWERFVEILNKLSTIQGDDPITLGTFFELFSAICSMATLGTLPHGLDELVIGSADRIRLMSPKVVFVCGCVEGEFPQNIGNSTILTNADRKTLTSDLGLALSPANEIAACDERFIAYYALTSSTEKLIVSYYTTSGSETELSASCIYKDIKERFSNVAELKSSNLDAYFFSETDESTFRTYASGYHKRSSLNVEKYNTIKAALDGNKDYEDKFVALDTIISNEPKEIKDKDLAKKLFGEPMNLSATRVETYYNCPFQYFCRYGIGAYKIKRVALDNQVRGTVIHYVLEQILKNQSKDDFQNMDEKTRDAEIEKYLKQYIDENFKGGALLDVTFNYQYSRLIKNIRGVIDRLIEEFKTSDFIPEKFEHPITDSFANANLKGDVDRIDVYTASDGTKYIRVVDYKTYVKDFSLSNVVKGLNLQMLLYLFAAKKEFETEPAGILYYKASANPTSIDERGLSADDLKQIRIEKSLSSGYYLNETEVLNAMENGMAGRFYKFGPNDLATLEEFGKIETGVTRLVNEMVASLHDGKIHINPVYEDNYHTGCKYCDYAAVCGFEGEEYTNKVDKNLKNRDAIEILEGGNDDE